MLSNYQIVLLVKYCTAGGWEDADRVRQAMVHCGWGDPGE